MTRLHIVKIVVLVILLAWVGAAGLSACSSIDSTSIQVAANPSPDTSGVQAYPSPLPLGGSPVAIYPAPEVSKLASAEPAVGTACQEGMQIEEVGVPAADGLVIRGDLYLPSTGGEPAPGVILLHMSYSSRRAWLDFPRTLVGECYAVLAVDLRGHGETGGEHDWVKARDDLQRVVDYLANRPETQSEKIALVGASIGANLSLTTAAANPALPAVVLLSPGLDYFRISTLDALDLYGERPLLIFVSEEDTYAAESSQKLDSFALGEHELVLFQGAGHGTDMFAHEPELPRQIMDWLDSHLK